MFTGNPIGRDLAFGAAAGFSNAIGLGLLYQGLATGRMGIVAPIAAMVGASIPVAVVAGGLISRETGDRSGAPVSRSVVIALVAGVGLGASLVLYGQTDSASGLWPVVAARIVAAIVAALAILVIVRNEPINLPRRRGVSRSARARAMSARPRSSSTASVTTSPSSSRRSPRSARASR